MGGASCPRRCALSTRTSGQARHSGSGLGCRGMRHAAVASGMPARRNAAGLQASTGHRARLPPRSLTPSARQRPGRAHCWALLPPTNNSVVAAAGSARMALHALHTVRGHRGASLAGAGATGSSKAAGSRHLSFRVPLQPARQLEKLASAPLRGRTQPGRATSAAGDRRCQKHAALKQDHCADRRALPSSDHCHFVAAGAQTHSARSIRCGRVGVQGARPRHKLNAPCAAVGARRRGPNASVVLASCESCARFHAAAHGYAR